MGTGFLTGSRSGSPGIIGIFRFLTFRCRGVQKMGNRSGSCPVPPRFQSMLSSTFFFFIPTHDNLQDKSERKKKPHHSSVTARPRRARPPHHPRTPPTLFLLCLAPPTRPRFRRRARRPRNEEFPRVPVAPASVSDEEKRRLTGWAAHFFKRGKSFHG